MLFWAKFDPIWTKRDPCGQFVRKVGKSALEMREQNSIIGFFNRYQPTDNGWHRLSGSALQIGSNQQTRTPCDSCNPSRQEPHVTAATRNNFVDPTTGSMVSHNYDLKHFLRTEWTREEFRCKLIRALT